MSRALLVNLDEQEVIAKCLAENVSISVIEPLPSGGTRLVCNSSEGAGTMTRKFKGRLITGPVTRTPFRPTKPLW